MAPFVVLWGPTVEKLRVGWNMLKIQGMYGATKADSEASIKWVSSTSSFFRSIDGSDASEGRRKKAVYL